MSVKRDIFKALIAEIDESEISVLLGPRQVGKSTLMHQLEKYLSDQKIKTKFFDLEDPRTLADFNLSPEEIIDLIDSTNAKVIFIDEFHYLKNASKIFKAIYDRGIRNPKQKIKIFASGSSTTEIHTHLKESLAGRKNTIRIHPLNFSEFKRADRKHQLDEFLTFGGLPGLLKRKTHKDKLYLINNILKTYIENDIKSLVREDNLSAFNNMLRIIAHNQGQVVDHSGIASEIRTSSHTVQRYLDLLDASFVVSPLYSYSKNLSNELKKSKKYYFYDNGIRNLLIEDFQPLNSREDKAALYEAYVFNHLKSKLLPNMSLKFWRTKKGEEIDFILSKNQIPYPLELKSKLKQASVPNSFFKFAEAYPETKDAFVINENLELMVDTGGFTVHFVKYENLESYQLLDDILDSVL